MTSSKEVTRVVALGLAEERSFCLRLEAAGFELMPAGSVDEALSWVRERPFHLILIGGSSRESLVGSLGLLGNRSVTRATPIVVVLDYAPAAEELASYLNDGAALVISTTSGSLVLEAQLRALARTRRLYLEALEQSFVDDLTGLYNRRFFMLRLEQEIARSRRYGIPVGCLVADIDHFKSINDSYDHLVGDEALCAVASVFILKTRQSDVAARLGGDEIAVLLSAATAAGIERFAEILRDETSEIRLAAAPAVRIALSVGYALYPQAGMKQSLDLLRSADQALLAAKREGRNRVVSAASRAAEDV